jgi:hypothetical protein
MKKFRNKEIMLNTFINNNYNDLVFNKITEVVYPDYNQVNPFAGHDLLDFRNMMWNHISDFLQHRYDVQNSNKYFIALNPTDNLEINFVELIKEYNNEQNQINTPTLQLGYDINNPKIFFTRSVVECLVENPLRNNNIYVICNFNRFRTIIELLDNVARRAPV